MSLQKAKNIHIFSKENLLQKFHIQSLKDVLITVLYSLIAIVCYVLLSLLPQPFTMVGLLKFGIIPTLALIPMLGAIRGPLAGFATGYFGPFFVDMILNQTIIASTIPYFIYGIFGFLVGLAQYQLNNGKSLAKLATLSTLTYFLVVIFLVLSALTIQQNPLVVVLGYVPIGGTGFLTMGIPSVFLLTPLYSRLWHFISNNAYPYVKNLLGKLKSRAD